MICIPFFFNTWEEFFTGELNFPMIHGVSEGTLIACTAINLSGFYGKEIWLTKLPIGSFNIQLNHFMVLVCFTSGLGFALNSVINVIRNYQEKRKEAFGNMAIFIFMISTLVIIINFSFNHSTILQHYPKVLLILYGFAFAKLLGHLQLAHICNSDFMQYRKSLLISFLSLALSSLIKHFYDFELINIDILIIVFLILHFIVWIHFAYFLSQEFCELLGIYRFSVQRREKLN